jgi:translation initiation factor 3 subunit H
MATQTTAQHMSQRHQQLQQQQNPQPDPSALSAQAALNIEDSPPVRIVQIAALVVMKIIKQCRDFFPSPSNGHLLGLDVNGVLQITNSYPLPSAQEDLPPNANLELERRRQQAIWAKNLSDVNVDNNMVGWYQSAYLGSFMNGRVVDGLLAAGHNQMLNDKAILIIHGTFSVDTLT